MIAAPLPLDEFDRVNMLRGIDLLDTEPDPVLDELVACAATITDCPVAMLSLVDARRQWFKAKLGTRLAQTPRDLAFCAYTILDDGLFEVTDATDDRRFHDNPIVAGAAGLRYYAGIPVLAGGYRIGALCVMDVQPRQMGERERSAMSKLARTVSNWMTQHYLHGHGGEAGKHLWKRPGAPVEVSSNRMGGFHLALRAH